MYDHAKIVAFTGRHPVNTNSPVPTVGMEMQTRIWRSILQSQQWGGGWEYKQEFGDRYSSPNSGEGDGNANKNLEIDTPVLRVGGWKYEQNFEIDTQL
jgi:hypothetical protein